MLKPTLDYVVIRPLRRQQSKILEVVSYEKQCRGMVVAVGPGKPNKRGIPMPLDVKVGEIVGFGDGNFDFYPKYYEGPQEFRIIQEADITGVYDNVTEADIIGTVEPAPAEIGIDQYVAMHNFMLNDPRAEEIISTPISQVVGVMGK